MRRRAPRPSGVSRATEAGEALAADGLVPVAERPPTRRGPALPRPAGGGGRLVPAHVLRRLLRRDRFHAAEPRAPPAAGTIGRPELGMPQPAFLAPRPAVFRPPARIVIPAVGDELAEGGVGHRRGVDPEGVDLDGMRRAFVVVGP